MEIDRILGLPAHPLVVHGVVALVPLCAVGVVLAALWPAARDRLAVPLVVLTAFSFALVPLVTESGEWLEERVGETPLVERHAELGEAYMPFVGALLVGAVAVAALYAVERWRGGASGTGSVPRWLVALVIVVALITSSAAAYETYLVGHSGAEAVWSGVG